MMGQDGPWGTVLNSLPFFGSYGGVLSDDENAKAALWAVYREATECNGVAASTIISNPLDTQESPAAGDILDFRIGQFTPMSFIGDTEPALLNRIDATARRNVRTAQRSGVTVSVENDNLRDLMDIHRENIISIGGRHKPDQFFTLLPRHFSSGKEYRVYVARIDGEIVAALLLLYSGNVVEYFIPGTLHGYRAQQPSALLLFRAMTEAAHDGYRLWNWGGTWLNQDGVLRFKRKWGAIDRTYRYHTRIRNTELLNQSPADLLANYGYFYVVPFSSLIAIKGSYS